MLEYERRSGPAREVLPIIYFWKFFQPLPPALYAGGKNATMAVAWANGEALGGRNATWITLEFSLPW
jgi:hypothetical protein